MRVILSRKQIEQLYEMIMEYSDENTVTLDISNSSGIGVNVSAIVKYSTCHEDQRDITDYEIW